VIRHYFFRLGHRRGVALFLNLIAPILGAMVCGYIWLSLSTPAKLIGFAWLAVGVVYLAALTRGFQTPPVKMELEQ
jgi:hypothetical protein